MLTRVSYLADGTQDQVFTLPFPYLNKTHVKASINGFNLVLPMLWQTDTTVKLQDFLATGDSVLFWRETPSDATMVSFTEPATLTTQDLNVAQLQNFYLAQETLDKLAGILGQGLGTFPGATPGGDAQTMLDNIVQSILNSELLAALQQRIGDIDTNAESIMEQIGRVDGHQDLLNKLGTGTGTAFILDQDTVKVDSDTTLAQRFSGLFANISGNTAAIANEQTVRADAVSALSQQISILVAGTTTFYVQATAPTSPHVGDVWYKSDDHNHPYKWDGTSWVDVRDGQFDILAAQISTEQTARTTGDTALAQTIALLGAVNGDHTAFVLDQTQVQVSPGTTLATKLTALAAADSSNAAAISSETTARVGADNALSTRIDTVTATAAGNSSTLQSEITARAGADSALGSRIDTVIATANGDRAAIQSNATAVAGANGALNAMYTLRLDVNGYVSGYGSINNGNSSSFYVLADQFAVVKPGSSGVVPFVVDGATGIVGISGSLIVTKSITANKINVDNLSAVSANMGTVTGGLFRTALSGYRVEVGNDTSWPLWYGSGAKSAANGLFYVDTAGNAVFAGAVQAANIAGGILDPSNLRVDTGGGRRAPILFEDCGSIYHYGQANSTITLATVYGPDYGSGYYAYRTVAKTMDVLFDWYVSGDSGDDSVSLQANYDGSGWYTVRNITAALNYRGGSFIKLRYTTRASWSYVTFRAITNSGHCMNLAFSMRVYNFGPSGNPPDGSSDGTGGSTGNNANTPPIFLMGKYLP